MHVSMILDPDTCMYDAYPILIHVTMMLICMMYLSILHVSMMHVSMILNPDTCMYDAYIYPDTLDYDAHMYDAFIHDACIHDACIHDP